MPTVPEAPRSGGPKIVQKRSKAPLESYIDKRPRKPRAKGRGFVTKNDDPNSRDPGPERTD